MYTGAAVLFRLSWEWRERVLLTLKWKYNPSGWMSGKHCVPDVHMEAGNVFSWPIVVYIGPCINDALCVPGTSVLPDSCHSELPLPRPRGTVLSRPDAPDDPSPPIASSEVRFGTGSDFGFHNPSPFFDLPSAHSESPHLKFGIRSVSVAM